MEWIVKNKEWLFSGAGIVSLTILYNLLKLLLRKKQQKPNINTFFQPVSQSPKDKGTKLQALYEERKGILNDYKKVKEEREELKRTYQSSYKDLIDWLSDNKNLLVERSIRKVLVEATSNKKHPKTAVEIKHFKRDLEQFIDQLEVCLLEESTKIIEEPYFDIIFSKSLYTESLHIIVGRVPKSISKRSIKKFKYYVEYLLDRL